jgi:hypothetical protein
MPFPDEGGRRSLAMDAPITRRTRVGRPPRTAARFMPARWTGWLRETATSDIAAVSG